MKSKMQCNHVSEVKTFGKQINITFSSEKAGVGVRERERVKPCFFLTFNIIVNHMFPESFIKDSQVIEKIFIFSFCSINYFYQFLSSFDISLLKKKLMTPAYN